MKRSDSRKIYSIQQIRDLHPSRVELFDNFVWATTMTVTQKEVFVEFTACKSASYDHTMS